MIKPHIYHNDNEVIRIITEGTYDECLEVIYTSEKNVIIKLILEENKGRVSREYKKP